MTVEELIKKKHCEVCWGDGNYCTEMNGRSVCGVCQLEGNTIVTKEEFK